MVRKIVQFAALAAASQILMALQRRLHRRRLHQQSSLRPEMLHTWEGEGGALYATGPQIGPEPVGSAASKGSLN